MLLLLQATPPAGFELRSLRPADTLVACVAGALGKVGEVSQSDARTVVLRAERRRGEAEPLLTVTIGEAGVQRVIRATYPSTLPYKDARKLFGRAAKACFKEDWNMHEWERR